MNSEEREFLNFILEHPEYYPLVRSEIMLAMLEKLSKEALGKEELLKAFKIARQDLNEIINVLESLKLVARVNVHQRTLYYASEAAKEFLQKYKKGRKEFGVIEK